MLVECHKDQVIHAAAKAVLAYEVKSKDKELSSLERKEALNRAVFCSELVNAAQRSAVDTTMMASAELTLLSEYWP